MFPSKQLLINNFYVLQSMKSGNNVFNTAIPAALIPFVAPLASFAAEGTGRVSY